jgi:hypothetical protein
MALPQINGLHLTRETLEHHLGTMTVEQGRQAYLAYVLASAGDDGEVSVIAERRVRNGSA